MLLLTFQNDSRGTLLGTRVRVADTFGSRLRGVKRIELSPGEGLFLTPCRGVHTFGIRSPLDIVLVDRFGVVVALSENLAPRRVSAWRRDAEGVLELPGWTIRASGTRVGDRLSWRVSDPGPVLMHDLR